MVPALCNVLGTTLVVLVLALVLPLALPRLLGYEAYDIVSGSMEPAIPMGSVIYVSDVEPKDVQVDDVIAFIDGESVVAHRVLINRTSLGEFVTKGDANNAEDPDPVPYSGLLGVVVFTVPMAGAAMSLYASPVGKVYLFMTLACGIMMNVLADRLREQQSREARKKVEAAKHGGALGDVDGDTPEDEKKRRARTRGWIRVVAMCACALVFLGSGGVVLYDIHQHRVSAEAYKKLAQSYTSPTGAKDPKVEPPIEVDFDELQAVNPDVVGWLYCPDSRIDYPVLRGETNDSYLHHNIEREYDFAGCLFVDSDNRGDFSDADTIIYGHHMIDDSMFGTLDDWASQAFYEDHPVMWLLTPTKNYQVVLVAGHHADALSDLYQIRSEHDDRFKQYLAMVVADSDFQPLEEATANPDRNYVMLTTCSMRFENERYVLHGKLVPLD